LKAQTFFFKIRVAGDQFLGTAAANREKGTSLHHHFCYKFNKILIKLIPYASSLYYSISI